MQEPGGVPGDEQTGGGGGEGTASLARCDPPVCKITARSKTAPGEQLKGGALLPSAPVRTDFMPGVTLQGRRAPSVLAAQSWGAPPPCRLHGPRTPAPGFVRLLPDSHRPFHDVSLPGKAFRRCPHD